MVLAALTLLLVASLLAGGVARAAETTLPGGTSISATITDPASGTAIVVGDDVTLTGTAAVGEGVDEPDTTLVITIDVSGSTQAPGGPCGNQNSHPLGDGLFNTILDCEILAALTLHQAALDSGSVAAVGIAVYGGRSSAGTVFDGHAADLDPGPGELLLTAPYADLNGNGVADVVEVLRSLRIARGVGLFTLRPDTGGLTNFAAGVEASCAIVDTSTTTTNVVAFLSDGIPTAGPPATSQLPCSKPAAFPTFAVTNEASCTTTNGRSSLQQIAAATGATCTLVPDPTDLPDIVRDLVGSTLERVELTIDGGAPVALPAAELTASLPAAGPTSTSFDTTVSGLAIGEHELCITAVGTDAGGEGSVTDCVDVTVNPPNTAPDCSATAASTPVLTQPNHRLTAVTVDGVTDDDGDDVAVTITAIQQDEPVRGLGSGDTGPDGFGVGTDTAQLRVERSGVGDGRVYHVDFEADDGNGGVCQGTVKVAVPHNASGAAAVDQGPLFDSTV